MHAAPLALTGVLFDWGHTLFDTAGSIGFIVDWSARAGRPIAEEDAAELHLAALQRSRRPEELARGRDLSLATHRECWIELWSELDRRAPGLAPALHDFETGAAGWSPYPDAETVLVALKERGIPVAVVSDVPFDLRPIFDHYGLLHLVDAIVLSGEHGSLKSEGTLFRLALDAIGRAPADVLMVGDNPANDGAAVAAGIRTLLLPHPRRGERRGLDVVLQLVGTSADRSAS